MDTIETGLSKPTRTIGRELVHAALRAAGTHGITEVTRDGARVAVVLPAGPAGRTPNRAERDALSGHLMGRYRPAFKAGAEVGEAELLGCWLGEFCDSGTDILAVCVAALTEANCHDVAADVDALRDVVRAELENPVYLPGTFVRAGHPGDVNDPERYPDGQG